MLEDETLLALGSIFDHTPRILSVLAVTAERFLSLHPRGPRRQFQCAQPIVNLCGRDGRGILLAHVCRESVQPDTEVSQIVPHPVDWTPDRSI